MNDEAAFLQAIDASPDDDTTRLVYADWLTEQNDPRAAYLRLEVDRHRLKPREKRRDELFRQLADLRPTADPHWLARIDRDPTRHSVFWPKDLWRQARRDGRVGQPLAQVRDRGNAGGRLPRGIRPGDYIYVVAYHTRAVHVLARMWVTAVHCHPFSDEIHTADGLEGTPLQLERPVPPAVLARLGWYSGKEERRAKLNADGTELANPDAVNRTLRLIPRTAIDFDAILRGDPEPPNLFSEVR